MVMAGGIALAMLWPSDEGDEGDEVAGDGVSEMVPSVATDVLSGETEESMCSWSVAELDDLESVVRQAHTDAGGAEEHGCPTGEVRRWHDVTILDLTSGPRGPGAIIIGTSGDAVVLDGPVLGAYLDPHGADAPLRIGHPIGDAVECTNGDRHLPLSATSSTPSALVTIDGTDSWRTVSGPAWTSHPCNPSPADSSQFCTPAGLVGPDSPSDASAFTTAIDSVAGPNDCFAGPIEALGAVLRFQPLTDPNGDRDGAVTVSSRTPAVRLSDAQWESYLRAASSGTDPGELASLAGIPASRTSTLDVSEVALDRSGKILGAADDQPHFFSPSLVINQWEAAGGPAGPHGLPIAGVSFGDGRLEQAFEGGSFVLDATGVLGFDEAPPADPFPLEPEHEGGLLISDRGDAFLVQGGRLSWVAPSDVDDCWGGASNTIVRDHPKRALIQMRKGPQARCADSPNFRSIDDASFCSRQLGDTAVVHRTSDPEAWECTTSRESEQIDLADLCNRQHGALAVPFTRTPSDVGTWTCKIERS